MTKKSPSPDRTVRADAKRNLDSLLEAAKFVFATSGVDAPVREIAEKAGVGLGTVYRHFPQRADLVAAVFRHELDLCAEAAVKFANEYEPDEALTKWLMRYSDFIATKRGLAPALCSGDPALQNLRAYFEQTIRPNFLSLLENAIKAEKIREDVQPDDILQAVASLGMSAYSTSSEHTQRMVALLIDGLRYRAPK